MSRAAPQLGEALARLPFALPIGSGSATLRRAVLRVAGPDAERFLQGLTTNNVKELSAAAPGQYTAFLSPQGRMMYDGFVWRLGEAAYLVEADYRIRHDLLCHIKQFQLRTKVAVDNVSDSWQATAAWPARRADGLSLADPRMDMTRTIAETAAPSEANAEQYTALRYALGVPEGPVEIARSQAIPLEYGIDLLGGVDYHKGCYLGQELVARTHHRGIIRKRILPLVISGTGEAVPTYDAAFRAALDPGTELEHAGAGVGRVVGTHGNLALALLRLEALPHAPFRHRGLTLTPHVPAHLAATLNKQL